MNTNEIMLHPETNHKKINSKLQKSMPWILGAATVVAGTLLIRAWIRSSNEIEHEDTAQPEKSSAAIPVSSIAAQLLPFATLFLKNWLNKRESAKEVATA